jgi:orotate phosphoribosyltransferase-like protein
MDSRVQDVMHQQQQLESDRATWESHWREIAERILPRQDDFQTKRVGGEKHTEKIFDATAPLALERAAAAIDSLITPETQQWHSLEPEDPALLDDPDTIAYLEEVTKMLFRMRYRPGANFAAQAHECYMSLMAFGTDGLYIDDVLGVGTRYKSIALAEMYIAENHAGAVDLVHRKFEYTVRQAVQKWGNKVPQAIAKLLDKEPFRKFPFIHCVKPNQDLMPGKRDYTGMDFSSYYVSIEGKEMMDIGGYRTSPYAVARHVTAPRETYGRSPAMTVLADIKMVNEMEKTTLRAAHKIVDPPLLVYGDGVLNAFSARPGSLNYGGVDDQGRQLVHPLKTGANIPIVLEMSEAKRKVINDAFYVTLFQILVENPRMTATEALIRAQEKGQLLAPTVGRQQSEFLGPIIERELDILAAAGALPPMPRQLARRGGGVKAIYTSPLSRLRRAEDGVAISRTIEQLSPLAQAKPDVMDVFDETMLGARLPKSMASR